jgi:hypothetical protein
MLVHEPIADAVPLPKASALAPGTYYLVNPDIADATRDTAVRRAVLAISQ